MSSRLHYFYLASSIYARRARVVSRIKSLPTCLAERTVVHPHTRGRVPTTDCKRQHIQSIPQHPAKVTIPALPMTTDRPSASTSKIPSHNNHHMKTPHHPRPQVLGHNQNQKQPVTCLSLNQNLPSKTISISISPSLLSRNSATMRHSTTPPQVPEHTPMPHSWPRATPP
jgi:hypothetical protein